MTYEEYLELERASDTRHEFLDGAIFAMSGGSPQHALLTAEVTTELSIQLRGRPCRVYSGDLRIHVEKTGLSTYPDLSVFCQALQPAEPDPIAGTNPIVLVEVLSATTEAYDRGTKFSHYRQIDSLQHYLLVSQREKRLELFTRADGIGWTLTEAKSGESLLLSAIDCTLAVDDICRDFVPEVAAVSGKYAALFTWLREQQADHIEAPLQRLDEIVGGLPQSARKYAAWWKGSPEASPQHTQKLAWSAAGFVVEAVDLDGEVVSFRRA